MSDFNKQENTEPQNPATTAEDAATAAEDAAATAEGAEHAEAQAVTNEPGEQEAESTGVDADADAKSNQRKPNRKKLGIIGIVVAIIAVVGVGLFVWHEQPSFCGAICHTPMDNYLKTYEAVPGQASVDKWGNQVSDASSMLASVHRQYGKTCLDCHKPVLSEQMSEGAEWVTGSYDAVLSERTTSQLIEASGLESSDEFCMNSSCHNYTREDLEKKTAWMGEINPHTPQHGEQKCSTCHKAHRQSVMYCTQCHTEAVVPDGWVDYTTSTQLEEASNAQ